MTEKKKNRAQMTKKERMIDEAESFAAGCSRDRLELRLVDEIHRLDARIAKAVAYIEYANEYGDELDHGDMLAFLQKDFA